MKNKNSLLFIVAVVTQVTTFAQPVITNQIGLGGYNEDHFASMYVTRDKGLIVGGSTNSKREHDPGAVNYVVIKFDSMHKIQWSKIIGGDGEDYLNEVEQTRDGGYILAGTSGSDKSGDKSENKKGKKDYWIIKLDKHDNIQWDKTIGGDNEERLTSLQETSDAGFILGGSSYSNISGDKTENSRGSYDYWVVKVDSLGSIQWDKTVGGSLVDYLQAIQQTVDKGFILGGRSYSNKSGEKAENNRGNTLTDDYWIVKLDSLGRVQWDKTIGGSDDDELLALQQTSDTGYILGGSSSSNISGEKTENSRGEWDCWVVKLNSAGIIQWDKTIGGSTGDYVCSLQQTTDGGYILGNNSASNISGEKTENNRGLSYTYDYWVVKLDKNGLVGWDKTIGGDKEDELGAIKEVSKNHFLIGGSSLSGISGDKTAAFKGIEDCWLVQLTYYPPHNLASTLQHSNLQIAQTKTLLIIYPNPAKDIIHVQTNGRAILSLTNQAGKVLLTKTIEGTGIINVAALSAGLYYLKNTATGEVQKVIVTK